MRTLAWRAQAGERSSIWRCVVDSSLAFRYLWRARKKTNVQSIRGARTRCANTRSNCSPRSRCCIGRGLSTRWKLNPICKCYSESQNDQRTIVPVCIIIMESVTGDRIQQWYSKGSCCALEASISYPRARTNCSVRFDPDLIGSKPFLANIASSSRALSVGCIANDEESIATRVLADYPLIQKTRTGTSGHRV